MWRAYVYFILSFAGSVRIAGVEVWLVRIWNYEILLRVFLLFVPHRKISVSEWRLFRNNTDTYMKTKKPHIRLMDISHERWSKTVFTHIDASIVSKQIVWLIWPNGAGKSTLLNIISWELVPRGGKTEVRWTLWVVSQWLDLGDDEKTMSVLEYIQWDHDPDELEQREISVALGRTSWDDIDIYQQVSTLSGGQQTKVRVAKCLVDEVDILLLDEPTNHLDQAGIKALQGIVKRFHWPVVIVSHDRQFLDDVTTHIFDLRFGVLEQYTSNYTGYMKERAIRNEKQLQEWKDQEGKRKKMEKRLAELRERANIYDSPRRGKLIRSRQRMYDKKYVDNAIVKPQQERAMWMWVWWGTHKHKKILTLDSGVVYRDAHDGTARFAEDIDDEQKELYMLCDSIEVLGQDRIVLVWENGSGKSTLIHVLLEHLFSEEQSSWSHPLVHRGNSLRVGWFMQQDDTLVVDQVVMHWCMKYFPEDRNESTIRSKLSGAGIPDDDLVKKMSQLSYGQRVKIRFLQLMVSAYDLLIMDEPTNHLDIETRESLETMLLQYEWALLIISHDRWFVEEVGMMKSWTIVDWELIAAPWTSTKAPREPYISSREKEALAKEKKQEEEVDPYDFMWKG